MDVVAHFIEAQKRLGKKGLKVSVATPLNRGRIYQTHNLGEAAFALSNRPLLAGYSQVEFVSPNGRPSYFIGTRELIDTYHVIFGFDAQTFFPILVHPPRDLESGLSVISPPGGGKSTLVGNAGRQITGNGGVFIVIGMKQIDFMPIGSLKAGCEALTHVDASGNLVAVPFGVFTLEPGLRTRGYNPFAQPKHPLTPAWVSASQEQMALSQAGTVQDAAQLYYQGQSIEVLEKAQDVNSFREQHEKISRLKLNRDQVYSTMGVRSSVSHFSMIDQMNQPADSPLNLSLERVFKHGGGIYFDCGFQTVGPLASAAAASIALSIMASKRVIAPDTYMVLAFDEAQAFPRQALKMLVSQARSAKVSVWPIFHSLEQLKDDAETITATQMKIILGAQPEGSTERLLQGLFPTKINHRWNFSDSATAGFGESVSYGVGLTRTFSNSQGECTGYGFAEIEEPSWSRNDTLKLNNDPNLFVLSATPGPFGPSAVLVNKGGLHMSYDDVAKHATEALNNPENTYVPNAPAETLPVTSALPEPLASKRVAWLSRFAAVAEAVRKEMAPI